MELVLVMLILAVASAMVAPSLHNFILGRKSHDAAAQILALGQYAHIQAVNHGGVYRLNLDTQARTYWLTHKDGATFRALGEEFGRTFTLPAGTTARWLSPDPTQGTGQSGMSASGPGISLTPRASASSNGANGLHSYIDFYPDGRVDAWNLEITDSTGRTSIGCKSETEPLTILERSAR